MGKILGDDDLNNLSTKIHYSYFDNKIENCDNVHFYEDTKKRLIQHEGLKKVSDKIMKALCYVYNESKRSDFNSNICNYFYYWLSDILLTYLKHKSSYRQTLDILYSFLYNNERVRKCNPIYYEMSENDIKKFKLIFDYSQDYDTYMKQLNDDSLKCTENYKNYLQNYVNSYKELQTECESEHNSYKYCEYFKQYFPNEVPSLLSTWACKLEETKEQTEKIKEGSSEDTGKTQSQSTVTGISGSDGPGRTSDSHSYSSSTGMGITPSSSNGTSSPITSKGITAIASTTGFLVPSFLMYKFTPAGTWINKLLGRKSNINHIPLRDSGIIEQFPDGGRFNTENDRFNISYSPE
ncbi:PIR protein [Plasmodium vivax]|uniref:VIR protein n=1 Tax=Plasmodium vivax TaxID=5855 RepID=A0A565A7H8_PLAVI|nr:PIR protein [Plasmodium vivax]